MIPPGPSRGNVLLLTDTRENADRLGRWIAATGEQAVVLTGAEKFLMEGGDDDSIDLLVTDLDSDDPASRVLLEKLLSGDLFRGVPQLHVFRDLALRHEFLSRHPDQVALSVAAPAETESFQARVRLGAEIGRLRREVSRTSIRDAMTGLYNRRYVLHRLDEEFARAKRYRTPLSLLILDIDHLKTVNDAYGQTAGDSVIRRVAQVIRTQVRREDLVGRVGEESFAAVLSGNRYRGAAVLGNKLRTDTEDLLVSYRGENVPVRISAGISTFPDNPSIATPDDLVRCAENALASAKTRGGNRVFIDEGVLARERRSVLVVDSDEALLDLAEDLLGLDDLEVVRADSARAALETLRFRRPDLIVLDLGLAEEAPDRLLERIPEIQTGERIPIIGLSRDPDADPDRLMHLGVDRFVTKPFSLSLLRNLARELLELYRPS